MNYLSVENLGRNLGERWLFRDLTFGILQGEKVALIGSNGSGKSSLMDVLAGKVPPDAGIVSIRKEIKVGYLHQNPDFNDAHTVLEVLFTSDNEITQAIRQYEKANESGDAEAISHYAEVLTRLNGWDYEAKVKQILGKLGIHDFDKRIGELSGGQKKRVFLAKVLIDEPDFLILDEPTNHLDLETIEWLESYLSASTMTLFLVTHDRYFLDKVCNRIMELNQSKIYKYQGNYAYYLEKKAEREEIAATVLEKDRNLLKKELEWMRRQPKARTHKAQYRIEAFHDLKERAAGPKKEDKLELSMKTERMGNKIMEIQHVSKGFNGTTFIKEFSYTFKKGDRIGIVGKNGLGKSTLLSLITEEIKPDMGKIVKGETIKIGYYKQEGLVFSPDQKVIESVREKADYIKMADGREISASAFLTLFLFPPEVQYSPISKLSGGERRRLQLLKVLVENPNFLILDEPTNDLDIATLNVLEDFLAGYGGCLLVVSHDRYFLDRLVDHTFAFEGDGYIRDYPGNYTDYRNWADEQAKELKKAPKVVEVKKPSASAETKRKLSFKEKMEFEALEKEIPELEKEKEELSQLLSGGLTDFEEIAKVSARLEELVSALEEKEMRWLELSEFA
ncbi:ABC transporter related protein [Leadbetterella byssophila DSM 17132]|uniref:ABC transporter related protein n=1 Tax=Leadbetterella byssophila (strain DSM 17132 / JCM 16389 / KACC 11308 / NBRC 106382 / 4M15) TaxID=649349 RepID=E4RVY6_LEAB4|nr:ABC-F family ATP-binding cassette domain-containing protein [Leadbetterella byssophila]ADQ18896.1 ABC transporter related protein [Leadbetterella byssophila DSM 17132]